MVAAGLGSAAAEAGDRVLVLHSDGSSWKSLQPWPERAAGVVLTPAMAAGRNADAVVAALTKAEGQFDVAFLSVPSPIRSPVPIWLARLVDQVVLVATEGITRRGETSQAAQLIRQAGGRISASVLVSSRDEFEDAPLSPARGRRIPPWRPGRLRQSADSTRTGARSTSRPASTYERSPPSPKSP
jgi:hypothetical protein